MRRATLAVGLLLAAAIAVASEPSSYSLDVDVSSAGQPGFYMCRAILTDLASGDVVFAPSVQLKAGGPARASSQDGDLLSEFQVNVDSETSKVTAQVRVTRAGRVVAAQKVSVALH